MNKAYIVAVILFVLSVVFLFFLNISGNNFSYNFSGDDGSGVSYLDVNLKDEVVDVFDNDDVFYTKKNLETPNVLRSLYLTIWSVSSQSKRESILKIVEETEINSVIIDVKNSRGELIFDYVSSLKDILSDLHDKNIYLIARIAVFQDSRLSDISPEFSLKDKKGNVWLDRKGYAWTDPASKGGWDYNINIAKQAIDAGFDEINYDYIRFPTDGDLDAIVYPYWDKDRDKSEVIRDFSEYSKNELKKYNINIKLSMDIFGYTFLRSSGLGIGQRLDYLLDNFDYIYPMLYPSHYGKGNFGFDNPAEYPYDVVRKTLEIGLDSLGDRKEDARKKIRPWIQVFDLGAIYTPEMIGDQIRATYDVLGLDNTGWLMWSPSNDYSKILEIDL